MGVRQFFGVPSGPTRGIKARSPPFEALAEKPGFWQPRCTSMVATLAHHKCPFPCASGKCTGIKDPSTLQSKIRVPGSNPAGLGFLPPFAENIEKLCVFVEVLFAETLLFCGKYWGAKGKCKEVQGNEGRKWEVDMTGKQGEMKGKQSGTERDMKGTKMKTRGAQGE